MQLNPLLHKNLILAMLLALSPLPSLAQTCQQAITASTPNAQFTSLVNATVTDSRTGLVWKRCSEGQTWNGTTCTGVSDIFNWQQALQQAQVINANGGFAGYNDWRVPNQKEIASIVEERCIDPAVNSEIFPATFSGLYWTSSPDVIDARQVFDISFLNGFVDVSGKNSSNRLRLVRGGK